MSEKITVDEWMEALRVADTVRVQKPDPGFVTNKQLQTKWNLSDSQVRKKLAILDQNGLLEKKKFNVKSGERGNFPTVHYRFLKKK